MGRLIDADVLLKQLKSDNKKANKLYWDYESRLVSSTKYRFAIEVLNNAPTIEPVKEKWIPTSERLPEETGKCYLISTYDGLIGMTYFLKDHTWHLLDEDEVTAWMPMPDVYEEDNL